MRREAIGPADYETSDTSCLPGRAELYSEGQKLLLNQGDSWVVPKGAEHKYRILENFTAVEVTHPPAAVHDRDKS